MEGLAVVIVDALTRREWVQEDYVPQAIDGAPDLRVRQFTDATATVNRAAPGTQRAMVCHLQSEHLLLHPPPVADWSQPPHAGLTAVLPALDTAESAAWCAS